MFLEANWDFGIQELIQIISAVITLGAIIVALFLGLRNEREKLSIRITKIHFNNQYNFLDLTFFVQNVSNRMIYLNSIVVEGIQTQNYDFIVDSELILHLTSPKDNGSDSLDEEYPKKMTENINLPFILAPGATVQTTSAIPYKDKAEYNLEKKYRFRVITGTKEHKYNKSKKTDSGWDIE